MRVSLHFHTELFSSTVEGPYSLVCQKISHVSQDHFIFWQWESLLLFHLFTFFFFPYVHETQRQSARRYVFFILFFPLDSIFSPVQCSSSFRETPTFVHANSRSTNSPNNRRDPPVFSFLCNEIRASI